jgi:ankyrin repeat protein
LHQAIQDSDTATIQKKCSSKTIINTKNKVGDTPLIAALKKGESAIALQLIEAGADLSITDADNNGPLLWASAKGLNAVVQRIFPTIHTAERTAVDGKGNTALHNAVLFGHTDTAFLLAAQPEIDISARNATGKTALQLAADSGNEVLFSHLLDIADKKNLGDAVASDQQNSSVHTLWNSFTAQAQVEKIDSDGYFKHRDKYKKLILTNQMGVNQEVSYNKSTLLSFAADEQDYEMVSLLLKKKANPSLKNNWNSTAFHYINTAAMAQLFLQADIDINQKGHNNWTLLHGASSNNNYALCEWLLRNGAQVDARDENDMSPVFLAHTVQIVQLFKKYNASLTIQDKWGKSLLHYAMRPEYDPKLILEYTELNPKKLQGNEGNTPWHELAQYCEKTSEKDLVAKVDYYLPYGKSSLTQKNMRLETPAETAKCWRESRCKTLAQVFIQLASEKPA